jgi:hypothetical protein
VTARKPYPFPCAVCARPALERNWYGIGPCCTTSAPHDPLEDEGTGRRHHSLFENQDGIPWSQVEPLHDDHERTPNP